MNISDFLKQENIFEYAVLPYSELTVTDPRRDKAMRESFVPQSALFFLMPYYVKGEKTNLSRYAHARDYHLFVKELYTRAQKVLPVPFCTFADTSPVDEVDGAVKAGLGCVGKNGLLINRRYGSWIFIGEFFFPVPSGSEFFAGCERKERTPSCLLCSKCEKACITGGISDKSLCVSCINQKKKADENDIEIICRTRLVWGCDECQEACPMNRGEETPIAFFKEKLIPRLDSETLDTLISSGEFKNRAYAWRGEEVISRNLKILEQKEKL